MADLEGQTEIAVDTEADSFFNYREKVCLIQVTVEDRDYLLDPLAGFDVAALGKILADASKEKIFHDGEYDILILKRDYGFEFAGLFDTRVAAAAMGEENPGLASVLKARFDVQLDKSMQRSNWSSRPLSNKQISYARLDTRFLIPLAREQKQELAQRGRMRMVEGECRRLEQLVPAEPLFNPDEYIRVSGARKLSLDGQRRLREVFTLRDRLAQKYDLPPFKVLGNQALLEIAGTDPKSVRALSEIHGYSLRQARRFGDQVLEALRRARELGPMERPPNLPARDGTGGMDDIELELFERLKSWRRDRAQAEGYDASLVLNRHLMPLLAKAQLTSIAGLEAIGLLDWQVREFGQEILDLVQKLQAEVAAGKVSGPRRRGFGRRRGSS
jgi:ribonuclease D